MNKVPASYDTVIMMVDGIFKKKAGDYGASWRILRPISVLDQIMIKAKRIQTVTELKEQRVNGEGNDIKSEFVGIVNYSAMGCIQLDRAPATVPDISFDESVTLYERALKQAQDDMLSYSGNKGNITQITDIDTLNNLIMRTINSMKSHFNSDGKIINRNLKKKFLDMINYAIFALMIINQKEEEKANKTTTGLP